MDYTDSPDWVITNPPWSKIRQFYQKCVDIKADNIVFLYNSNALMTKARLRLIYNNGYGIKEIFCIKAPTSNWPQAGFQLGATHVQKGYVGDITFSGAIGQ